MLKNIAKIIAIFVLGIVGGIFADLIFSPYLAKNPLFSKYKIAQSPIYLTEKKEIVIQENIALRDGVEKAQKTVVGVKAKLKNGKTSEGSGIIVSSDGLAVTLADLIPAGAEMSIFWEGETPALEVLKKDSKENLALVKIQKTNLPTAGFADLGRIRLGERVFLVGIIFEKGGAPKKMVNEGIVKSFSENSISTNIFEKITLSGSPLFNIEGNVLGLNTIDQEGKVITIPISKIRNFIGF